MKTIANTLPLLCLTVLAALAAKASDDVVRLDWSALSKGPTNRFERQLDSGIVVKGCLRRTYLKKAYDLVELAVENPNSVVRPPLCIVAPKDVTVKLVSELPSGWLARQAGETTEITIPVDRPRRAYPDEAILPRPQNVPDLLVANDGRRITTAEEWERIRRPEILDFFERNVYGRRPCERPPYLKFERVGEDRVMMDGAAIRKIIRITYGGPKGTNSFPVTAFIPARREKPASSFVLICNRDRSNIDPERIEKSPFWPAERIVERGFAAIAFFNGDVTPDYVHGNTVGAHTAFVDADCKYHNKESWGMLSSWGWAASRVLDWIETEPMLDAKRVAVVGHSRGGKTALWAGAEDRRFAMVCVNDSGSCGMKLNHIDMPASEHPVHTIMGRQDWYCLNFTRFANRECDAPFDTHCLAALIAPRKLCVASASDDVEAGPLGEFWGAYLSSPAWELYGKRGLVAPNGFPGVEQPLQDGGISYHIRRGEHNLKHYDWDRYMDFFTD